MIDQPEKKNYLPGILVWGGIFVACVVIWSETFMLLERFVESFFQ